MRTTPDIASPTSQVELNSDALGKGRILIIYKEAEKIHYIKTLLSKLYIVLPVKVADNPASPASLCREYNADLVLINLSDIDGDGIEFCKSIRSDNELSDLPIVFVSSQHNSKIETLVFNSGGNDFISLPAPNEVFLGRIAKHTYLSQRLKSLKSQAVTDPLTGLPNRRSIELILDREWRACARAAKPISAIMIDIDYFKQFNDLNGHLAGDECLRRIAAILFHHMQRGRDFAGRFGGEEFLCLIPEGGLKAAQERAESIRRAVEALKIAHGLSVISNYITVSLGIGYVKHPAINTDKWSIVDSADQALYEAKRNGRNRVEYNKA